METALDTEARVRLYLDVDGVINAQMPNGWGRLSNGHAGYPLSYSIRWAPGMVDALRDLDVDLVWATTWRDQAVSHIAPLIDFGQDSRWLSPQSESQMMDWSIKWKEQAVALDQQDSPSPFVWLDDELEQTHIERWPDALVIPINSRIGVTPADVAAIHKYVKAVS